MLGNIIAAGANILGGIIGKSSEERTAERNNAMQKEFAQHGIQWKVEDAKAAGVHPLFALGANTHSFAPNQVGSNSLGAGLAAAGQDISRAVHATSTDAQRTTAYTQAAQALSLQRMGLENDLLASQIAKIRQVGSVPAFPTSDNRFLIDGQGDGKAPIMDAALNRVTAAPEALQQEVGPVTDVGMSRTSTGGYAPMMSKDTQDRLEEDMIGTIGWNVRNRLLPTLGYNQAPPPVPAGDGKVWVYHPGLQEYQLVNGRTWKAWLLGGADWKGRPINRR